MVVLFGVAEFLRVMHAEKFGDDILSFDPRHLHLGLRFIVAAFFLFIYLGYG